MNNRLRPRSKSANARSLLPADDIRGNSPRNNHFINKNAKKVRLVSPDCYNKGGLLSFRIWNMLNPEDPNELLNGRTSQYDIAGLEGVSISEPFFACVYAGVNNKTDRIIGHEEKECNPVSYIIARSKTQVVDGIDFWEEPYVKFSKVAKDAHGSGRFTANRKWDPDWNCLLAENKNKAITAWKQQYAIVGSIYNNGPKLDLVREDMGYEKNGKMIENEVERFGIPLGEAPDDPVPLLTISASAGRKLIELMTATKEKFEGDPDVDPAVMYKYGDPCGKFNSVARTVDGGVFFHLFNPETFNPDPNDPIHKQLMKNTTYTFKTPEEIAKEAKSKNSKNSKRSEQVSLYEAAVSAGIVGPNGLIKPNLSKAQVYNIASKHLFFWKESDQDPADSYFLYEPSIEERCTWIATAFKFVPKLVELCWMSNPEYLAFDSVKAVLRNRTQVRIPEYTPEAEADTQEEVEVVETKVTSKKVTKPSTTVSTESLMDEFEAIATEVETVAAKKSTKKTPDAENLMEDFDDFEAGGEVEAEDDDDQDGAVEQFEQLESFEDEVSADFDPQTDDSEDDDADPFQAEVQKSLETAKAVSRSAARNSKPKK